ncbi:MAG: hypothetical protein ACXVCH_17800 [Bdellovibrionota bacterium]
MLKAIGWAVKVAVFAAVVLVLGNRIRIGSKTVSDQVRTGLAHAERSEIAGDMRDWATKLTQDARRGLQKKSLAPREEIPSSERQKLRALIQELNSSR